MFRSKSMKSSFSRENMKSSKSCYFPRLEKVKIIGLSAHLRALKSWRQTVLELLLTFQTLSKHPAEKCSLSDSFYNEVVSRKSPFFWLQKGLLYTSKIGYDWLIHFLFGKWTSNRFDLIKIWKQDHSVRIT